MALLYPQKNGQNDQQSAPPGGLAVVEPKEARARLGRPGPTKRPAAFRRWPGNWEKFSEKRGKTTEHVGKLVKTGRFLWEN